MAPTGINGEDRLVQRMFAEHLEKVLGWESVYAYNAETFGPDGTLGRMSERDVVLMRGLRAAPERLNPDLPAPAREQVIDFRRPTAARDPIPPRLMSGEIAV